ncbi:hypothetical protein BDN72DRAFT_898061 [Pluteus cervinus]|uniref:Uncharacterized protein n=1 Tax=Pluteus cervinus TaxID=181527 RepID=A0ACD3AT50_9AGAR|nr:hypothetical protein BDN72DRAFT_898061 [Pluteus cervinus]
MNRIVQRNGAAPAWVEIQVELESASQNFREVIRKAWIRRAVRMVSASNPPELLRSFTLTDVKNMRDREWEDRERSYHEAALRELNSLIRKYNTLAPFVARRPYYMLKVELERMYEDCVEDILKGLIEASERGPIRDFGGTTASAGAGTGTSPRNAGDDVDSRVGVGGDSEGVSNWLRHIVEWMGRIISRWRSR